MDNDFIDLGRDMFVCTAPNGTVITEEEWQESYSLADRDTWK